MELRRIVMVSGTLLVASCRRKFSLDVVLLDAIGHSVHKEIEILASLVYADDGTAVKKPDDNAEGPLILNCGGLEFPSTERAVKLIDGRATIKLKISQGANVIRTDVESKFEHHMGIDNVLSDSESTDARNSVFIRIHDTRKTISDTTVFKYCLEGTEERSLLLREVVAFASDEDIMDFAEQVSLYAGCPHHRYQILIAKQLVQEGNDSWKSISHNENRVLWSDVIPEIDRKFRKISCSISRGLSGQDIESLRKIVGCGDDLAREHFDKMWHWLFPVALTLSRDHINALWESKSPRWIEGIITKEEAESSLRGPRGYMDPGTYILRFPTSRSWPHPDAGSLVVTYVGADYTLRNRILSIDDRDVNSRPLQDLLLHEPELSQLGRVTREATQHWRDEA